MYQLFIKQITKDIEQLTNPNLSFVTFKRLIHNLKGSSAFINLTNICDFCVFLENKITVDNYKDIYPHLKHLSYDFKHLVKINHFDFKKTNTYLFLTEGLNLEPINDSPSVKFSLRNCLEINQNLKLNKLFYEQDPKIKNELLNTITNLNNMFNVNATLNMTPLTSKIDPKSHDHLLQILTNMIINSYTHGFKEGEKEKAVINIHFEETPTTIKCIFSNNGKPIDKNKILEKGKSLNLAIPNDPLDLIFTPNFSTKNQNQIAGAGLGLCHIKQLCDSLAGNIKVKSHNNLTTFTFMIKRCIIITTIAIIQTNPYVGVIIDEVTSKTKVIDVITTELFLENKVYYGMYRNKTLIVKCTTTNYISKLLFYATNNYEYVYLLNNIPSYLDFKHYGKLTNYKASNKARFAVINV